MKRYYIILAILGPLLIIGGVIGLVWNNKVSPVPTLTAEQVISRVQVYGVADIPSNYGSALNPVGLWSAVYEGENTWRVRGTVVRTRYEGKDYYYSTTWTHNNTKIQLVSIIREPYGPRVIPGVPTERQTPPTRPSEGILGPNPFE